MMDCRSAEIETSESEKDQKHNGLFVSDLILVISILFPPEHFNILTGRNYKKEQHRFSLITRYRRLSSRAPTPSLFRLTCDCLSKQVKPSVKFEFPMILTRVSKIIESEWLT